MLLILCKALILVHQFYNLALRPRPLALDIAQCVKDGKIEIDRRQPKRFPVTACCHLILHSITRIKLREASNPAEPDIHVVLNLPVVLRNIQKLLHLLFRNRHFIVLMNGLTYLVWRHLHSLI